MDSNTFDAVTRTFGRSLTRRTAVRGLAASALAAVTGGRLLEAEAKKGKKKNKNKNDNNNNTGTPPANTGTPAPSFFCPNLNTACGLGANTLVCNCRLSKEGTQTCGNVVNPPNGAVFEPCQQSSNCPSGQFCDFIGNVCRSRCATG
jgi:hypothetical protein